MDRGVYGAFGAASWDRGLRWRLVGGAAALLAAGVVLARVVSRGRRWVGVLGVAAVSGGLGAVAWGVMLPQGRGVLETAGLVEAVAGEAGGRRTELVCVGATGHSRVRLDFGRAEAVVPFYYGSEDAGTWSGVVVERDAAGRWTVGCELTGNTRRCFAAWWGWGQAPQAGEAQAVFVRGEDYVAADGQGSVPGTGWRPLRELSAWGRVGRALLEWQAKRAKAGRTYKVAAVEDGAAMVVGEGLMARQAQPTQVWQELGE